MLGHFNTRTEAFNTITQMMNISKPRSVCLCGYFSFFLESFTIFFLDESSLLCIQTCPKPVLRLLMPVERFQPKSQKFSFLQLPLCISQRYRCAIFFRFSIVTSNDDPDEQIFDKEVTHDHPDNNK